MSVLGVVGVLLATAALGLVMRPLQRAPRWIAGSLVVAGVVMFVLGTRRPVPPDSNVETLIRQACGDAARYVDSLADAHDRRRPEQSNGDAWRQGADMLGYFERLCLGDAAYGSCLVNLTRHPMTPGFSAGLRDIAHAYREGVPCGSAPRLPLPAPRRDDVELNDG